MIDRDHALPLNSQARLLGLSRCNLYYARKPPDPKTLALMRRIDAIHLEHPFMGARMIRDTLHLEGREVGRKRITSLMQIMGIEALYRAPRTTVRHPGHRIFPYLLREMVIDQANQVWAMDITYIPMETGFCYLAVVLDWSSRRVLSYELSITLETDFCIRAMETALSLYGNPSIANTDQGVQFTSDAFTGLLLERGITISMDGKGAWRDNVFIERLWRSVKYEEVYLHAYESVAAARAALARFFEFYNERRPHTHLDGSTPDRAYFAGLEARMHAA